jgi:hypothetical protein
LIRFASPPPEILSETNQKAFNFFTEDKVYAVIAVGHLPQLTWLAYRITGKSIPMRHSEILCFEVVKRRPQDSIFSRLFDQMGTLQWVLSPSDRKATRELKEKIKSKMDTAKVLSVFITAGFGFIVKTIVELDANTSLYHVWGYRLTALFFFLSIVLYLMSMYSFDTLLMPTRFWADGSPGTMLKRPTWVVARPPSAAHWVLYQNMIHVWKRQFSLATACVLLGLIGFGFVASSNDENWIIIAIAMVTLALLMVALIFKGTPLWLRRLIGPWLGSED